MRSYFRWDWWRMKLLYFYEFYPKIWVGYNFLFCGQIPKGRILYLFISKLRCVKFYCSGAAWVQHKILDAFSLFCLQFLLFEIDFCFVLFCGNFSSASFCKIVLPAVFQNSFLCFLWLNIIFKRLFSKAFVFRNKCTIA